MAVRLVLNTNEQPLMLATTVDAPVGSEVSVSVKDSLMPDTYYSKSVEVISSYPPPTIFTRLPLSPKKAIFEVTGANLLDIKHYPLYTNSSTYTSNQDLRSYLKFIQFFARRKNILVSKPHTSDDVDSYYKSDDGKFTFQYVDELFDWNKEIIGADGKPVRNPNYGHPVTSSMRINSATKLQQIAKKYAYDYTIPEFIVVSLHEFAHGHLNAKPEDEMEADRNAIRIYSGLGFPRQEGVNAWIKIFQRTHNARPDTRQDDMNIKERLAAIMKESEKLDKQTFKVVGKGMGIGINGKA